MSYPRSLSLATSAFMFALIGILCSNPSMMELISLVLINAIASVNLYLGLQPHTKSEDTP